MSFAVPAEAYDRFGRPATSASVCRTSQRWLAPAKVTLSTSSSASGLRQVEQTVLVARVEYATFEGWWEPFAFGVGPAGKVFLTLTPDQRAGLRERCEELLPRAPFELVSFAWAARGVVQGRRPTK